jgi:putative SOS response-associated peptidase YedK
MCGRYRLSRRKQPLEEYFGAVPGDYDWEPRYNIAPTQPVPVIHQNPKQTVRELSLLRWGLIPSWSNDASAAVNMINARSETASTLPSFCESLRLRRCLVPADGFYEWKRTGKTKQPHCFEVENGSLFAFAGLWDRWTGRDGRTVETCSILTTAPNSLTATVHNRMPVILKPESYDQWLDPGVKKESAVCGLLKPYDALLMRCFPVSSRVNFVANDDESCSALFESSDPQIQLFS